MILVTGATGKLGGHVIQQLVQKVPANQIVAAVRDPGKAADLAKLGVHVRLADYDRPDTLASALAGVNKVLLISASEPGGRLARHRAVIDAAKKAGVRLLVYTSILHAASSTLALAAGHKATEEAIRASGLPFVFLRNGWYIENYNENLGPVLAQGAVLASSGDGRVAAATRVDFAAAAVAVLTGTGQENRIYEFGGDVPFSMADFAAEVSTYHWASARQGRTPFFSDRERAALAWVETLTHIGNGVPDDLYAEARKEFSEKELVDLTWAAAAINAWNRVAISMRVVTGSYQGSALETPHHRHSAVGVRRGARRCDRREWQRIARPAARRCLHAGSRGRVGGVYGARQAARRHGCRRDRLRVGHRDGHGPARRRCGAVSRPMAGSLAAGLARHAIPGRRCIRPGVRRLQPCTA